MSSYNTEPYGTPGAILVSALDYLYRAWVRSSAQRDGNAAPCACPEAEAPLRAIGRQEVCPSSGVC